MTWRRCRSPRGMIVGKLPPSIHRAKRFLICLVATGEIIGQCSLGEIIRGPFQHAFMGYWLVRAHTGKGPKLRPRRHFSLF